MLGLLSAFTSRFGSGKALRVLAGVGPGVRERVAGLEATVEEALLHELAKRKLYDVQITRLPLHVQSDILRHGGKLPRPSEE